MHQWPSGRATQKVVVYPIPRPSWETKADVSQSNENLHQLENEATGSNDQSRNLSCVVQLDASVPKAVGPDREIFTLREQLDAQIKVNSDLKKLLIASIGEDLHCKMDVLVRTKAHLTNEVTSCTSKMLEDYESIDKLTVETDLWRTKFQAACVLLNLLTSEKNKRDEAFLRSQTSLQALLDERRLLNSVLLQTNDFLNCIHSKLFPLKQQQQQQQQKQRLQQTTSRPTDLTTTTDLALSNCSLVETIYGLLHGPGAGPSRLPDPSRSLTFAEALATEVLTKDSQDVGSSDSSSDICSIVRSSKTFLGTTFNCCKKCKGRLMNV